MKQSLFSHICVAADFGNKLSFPLQVCNPSISVYKGYCLPKEAEEYLASHGLNNATYSISAVDLREDLLGELVACPYQVG